MWLLSQIKSFLSTEGKLLFYNAYIKPHLDYCSAIWGNSTNFNIQKITKLQTRACKIILGRDYTDLQEARNRQNILSFDESIFLQKAKSIYKIANNIAPVYLTDLFQMTNIISDSLVSNLRSVSKSNFVILRPKINKIPLKIRNTSTINSFITKCTAWMKSE